VYGWRDTSAANWKPNCAKRGKNCFVENGKTYLRFPTFERAYAPGKRRTDKTRYFRPQVRGMYEVCAVADYGNIIKEGTSGEANNSTCRPIQVDDVDVPDDAGLTITGPVTLTADPALVRRGNTSGLSWDTGGRLVCEITGTNGSTIPVTSVTGVVPTVAITAQTTYTLSCTDVGYEGTDDATIRILPQLQEI
jgi:hypothetical protein